MFKRNRKHRAQWVGPLFALEALRVTFAAKREMDSAVAAQLQELAKQP